MSNEIDFSKLAIKTIFPIDMGEVKYCHIEFPVSDEELDYKKHCQTYSNYAVAKIPISKDEFVDMKLNVLTNGDTKYTMQYRNPSLDIRVRTDDAHGFPHIDIEEKGKPQKKFRLKISPNNYEESINTILRFVEENVNHLIGPRYWLMPQIITPIGSHILKLFDVFQQGYNLKTSFTDLARLTSLDILRKTLSNKIIDYQEYQDIIHNQFTKCFGEESNNGGKPILASSNKNMEGISLLPFPLILPSGVSFKMNYLKNDYSLTNLDDKLIKGFVIETY